jgi:hypothetical protein
MLSWGVIPARSIARWLSRSRARTRSRPCSDGRSTTVATFDETYETIFAYSFEAKDTPTRVFCRPEARRQCWSCEHDDTMKKFTSDAHVIPAALGNRSIFSLEECDDCNNGSGKTLDQALSDYLTLWRAVSRIRTRRGRFKHRTVPDRSYIEGRPQDNRLVLEIYDGETTVQLEDKGNGQLTLRTSVPPSNPVSACKAIARMAYLCMSDEDRARNAHLRRWILGELEYLPTFFEAFLPGTGQRLVTLRLFRAGAETADVAPYLVEFDYGSVVIFLPLLGTDLHPPKSTPLPDVPHSPYPPHVPQVTKVTCTKDDRVPRRMEEISIRYCSKIELDKLDTDVDVADVLSAGAVLEMSKVPAVSSSPVSIEGIDCPIKVLFVSPEGHVLTEATGRVRSTRWDARNLELNTYDEILGWSLRFVVRPDGTGDVHVEWADPCQLPIEVALRHLQMRKNARSARTIELRMLGSNAPFVWSEVGTVSMGWDPPPLTIEVTERLALVARKTGEDVRLPPKVDEQAVREIEWGLERRRIW